MGGAASATGTDETETSVGRVAIQDEGYLDSGAEHRGGDENDGVRCPTSLTANGRSENCFTAV
jgi:hypothetical protein